MTTPLLLLGCGNMGSALLTRWMETLGTIFAPVHVVDPQVKYTLDGVFYAKQLEALPQNFNPEIIVIAVKPQQLDDVLPVLAKKFGNKPTYLSIAAGKSLAFYTGSLGENTSIVRAMPNTPAMIGEGITAMVGSKGLSYEGRTHATQLMGAVGETLWLDDEKLMDAVTAISGSGPGYYFTIMECMVAAGMKHRLSKEMATTLAIKTAVGSTALALQSDASLADLRNQVTSPGGTTAAALAVLDKDHILQELIEKAVDAAVARASEL